MITQNTSEAVRLRILAWKDAQGLSVKGLADRAGVSHGSLRNLKHAGWKPSFAVVKRVEALIPHNFNIDLSAPPSGAA
jgi:transcriptional regulator with XRE-family HTH domain